MANSNLSLGGKGSTKGCLNQPMGVCVDNNGRVIVADSGNKRVVLYSSEGVFIKELYKSDFDKTPMCVCAPSMDRVLVHLASPGKVQIRPWITQLKDQISKLHHTIT